MTKMSENTQVALMSKDISQIQKDVASLTTKFDMFANARFVTSNEMQLAIKQAVDGAYKEIFMQVQSTNDKLNQIQKILWFIFSAFGLIIVGALGRMILKI